MRVNAEGRKLIEFIRDGYTPDESQRDAEKAVKRFVKPLLTNNQFSALVSLVMSIGIDTFRKSRLLMTINGNIKDSLLKAADHFDHYIYSEDESGKWKPDRELIAYREMEKALFLKPELVKKRRVK
jgi:GH24 family phage-related lysozyme (muramidase)